jgi:V8-like Glu-specific endopeptidase
MKKAKGSSKLLVKATGILTALAMSTCLTAYFDSGYEVSASTTILRGDVDLSNSVGLSDLVLENKYLIGQTNIDPDRADINQDGVVDAADSSYLANHLVNSPVTPAWTNTYTVTSMTSNNAGTRGYISHNVSQNSNSSYNLSVSQPNNIMPLMIIGNDDREDDPYTGNYADAIVEVGTLSSAGFYPRGTGFIIDNNKVVTNAHVVYEQSESQWKCNAIRINGTTTYNISRSHVPYEYVYPDEEYAYNTINETYMYYNCYYDYALLKINTSVNLATTYGGINVGVATDKMLANSNLLMAVAGYPSDRYSSVPNANNLYIGYGNFLGTEYNDLPNGFKAWQLKYTADTVTRNSGSPAFFDKDGNENTTSDLVAVGVHFGQHEVDVNNRGIRFTSQHLKFFFNNNYFNSL